MLFQQTKNILAIQKGVCLLFATVFTIGATTESLWPNSLTIIADEQIIRPSNSLSYYGTLGAGLLIGLTALMLFRWLHLRARLVTASDVGLQILTTPIKAVLWSEVYSIKKSLPNLMSGFYLISLIDGTEVYTPIEHESPRFSTLWNWGTDPALFERLCIQHGVWIR